MKTICINYLNNWFKYGYFALFNWYAAGAADYNTPYGTWAITENFENSQKLQAIDSVHGAPVPSFSVGQLAATVDSRKYAGYNASALQNTYFQPTQGYPLLYEYLIRVPSGGGAYRIIFKTCADRDNQSYKVEIDNSLIKIITPINNGFASYKNDTAATAIQLGEGLHTIRITPAGGFNFRIKNILFSLTGSCSLPQDIINNSTLTSNELTNKTKMLNATNNKIACLKQNVPNPFNKTTIISYNIPPGFRKAMLLINNFSGQVVKQINITSAGCRNINIDGSTLANGTYNYTLIVDGKRIDSKKMILMR